MVLKINELREGEQKKEPKRTTEKKYTHFFLGFLTALILAPYFGGNIENKELTLTQNAA